MKKYLKLSIIASLAITSIEASAISYGKVSGEIKVMHILGDKTNAWTPEEGSGYLGKLKYVTPEVLTKGLKLGAAFYVNGDTGLTDWDDTSTKKAYGMFTDKNGDTKTILGEAYLEYKGTNFNAKLGRQILNTPLTTIKWSLMPNFYEAYVLGTDAIENFSFTLAHISKFSFGSRSAADFGLIGEGTKTAGLAVKPISANGTLEDASFLNMGEAAGVKNTNGITALSATYYGIENLTLCIWDYRAYDTANMIYADAKYKMIIDKNINLDLSAQYLSQD